MRSGLATAAACVAAIVVAGCSETTAGEPTDTTATGGGGADPSASPSSSDPIPPVADPRDLSGFAERPCELLTPAQLTSLMIDQPGEQGVVGEDFGVPAASCTWEDSGHTREIALWSNIGPDVLDNTYARRTGNEHRFDLTDIDGYPAIVTQSTSSSTTCRIRLGVADTETMRVMQKPPEEVSLFGVSRLVGQWSPRRIGRLLQ